MKEEYDFLQDKVNTLQSQKAELQRRHESMLNEYKELRKKLDFIEQGQPHPCFYDGKRWTSEYTFRDWLKKLKEEVAEVEVEVERFKAKHKYYIDEVKEEEIEHLTEELLDVITVATSALDYLGWSVYGRCQKQKEVNEKNRRRGYWK